MQILMMALALAAPASTAQSQAAPVPAAVIADRARDTEHPAQLLQIRYPTGGVEVPARLFVAGGEGAHPTVLLLHGFPGTELNLDLARAIQRAGWNVMAIHYRGVWGAPGKFSFGHTIEDARAALAWLRDPARTGIVDASRIVVLGHSMGGFDTVMIGDEPVAGFVTISAADFGGEAASLDTPEERAANEAGWAEDVSFTNMTFAEMATEIAAHAGAWDWSRNAAEMVGRPVLVIDSNDGLEPNGDAVVAAVTTAGGPAPTRLKFETDHSYNDHRITLAVAVVGWLETTFPAIGR
ncbi:MAG TPA: alpha/beta fold hydrolase [Brevundimonas sp.]|nr:alpha/beta fold hydrolase [Brevundimonas sp.]